MYPTFRNGREGWGTLGMGVRVEQQVPRLRSLGRLSVGSPRRPGVTALFISLVTRLSQRRLEWGNGRQL